MKYRYILFCLSALFSLTCVAQNGRFKDSKKAPARTAVHRDGKEDKSWQRDSERNYVGIRLGVNASQLHTRNLSADRKSKAGLTGGIVVGWRLFRSSHLYLESGVLYIGKGANLRGEGYLDGSLTTSQDEQIRMHYFEMPLVIKGRISTPLERLSVAPYAGVFGSIGIGGKMKYLLAREETTSFRTDAFRRGDAGIRIGCGLNYGHLYFDAGYDVGLVNVAKPSLKDFSYDNIASRIRTGNLVFSIGLDF